MTEAYPLRRSDTLSLPLRVAELPGRGEVRFQLTPDTGARAALAKDLGIERVRKLVFGGTLRPEGRHDWRLEGTLGATVVQACVVSGAPVTTRIDVPVSRLFLRRMPEVDALEAEIPEDDSIEPLGSILDPGAVMVEALALELPDYPRAEGATFESGDVAGPEGGEPVRRTPFAALEALKRDLE
ncbi:YceD family protein [Pararhodobacter sp.]